MIDSDDERWAFPSHRQQRDSDRDRPRDRSDLDEYGRSSKRRKLDEDEDKRDSERKTRDYDRTARDRNDDDRYSSRKYEDDERSSSRHYHDHRRDDDRYSRRRYDDDRERYDDRRDRHTDRYDRRDYREDDRSDRFSSRRDSRDDNRDRREHREYDRDAYLQDREQYDQRRKETYERRKEALAEEPLPPLFSIHHGKVVSITEFGIFVELPGYRRHGLVHKSQLSNYKIEGSALHEMYSKGEEVWVKVIGDDDGKISLSLKYVNQTTGEDMDPNNTRLTTELQRRKAVSEGEKPERPPITLTYDYDTTCTKCGGRGHIASECFVKIQGSTKEYELLEADDPEEERLYREEELRQLMASLKRKSGDDKEKHKSDKKHKHKDKDKHKDKHSRKDKDKSKHKDKEKRKDKHKEKKDKKER